MWALAVVTESRWGFTTHQKTLLGIIERGKTPKEKQKERVEFTKAQIKELMTNYGPMDVMFHKGILVQYCHELDPNCIVTRGEMTI